MKTIQRFLIWGWFFVGLGAVFGLWAILVIFGDANWRFWAWNPASWQAVATGLTGLALGAVALLAFFLQRQQAVWLRLEAQVLYNPQLFAYPISISTDQDWYYYWKIGLVNYSRVPMVTGIACLFAIWMDGTQQPIKDIPAEVYMHISDYPGVGSGSIENITLILPEAHKIIEFRVTHSEGKDGRKS